MSTIFQNDWLVLKQDRNDVPRKLILKLDHEYTQHSLNFESLRGQDKKYADLLKSLTLDGGEKLALYLVHGTKRKDG